jgi:hypothetical protein
MLSRVRHLGTGERILGASRGCARAILAGASCDRGARYPGVRSRDCRERYVREPNCAPRTRRGTRVQFRARSNGRACVALRIMCATYTSDMERASQARKDEPVCNRARSSTARRRRDWRAINATCARDFVPGRADMDRAHIADVDRARFARDIRARYFARFI